MKLNRAETELNKLLQKIGKQIFVQYFCKFRDLRISNQEMIALLPNKYTFKSRTSRTSKSRRIFRECLEEQALSIIAESNRVERKVADEARALLSSRPNYQNGPRLLLANRFAKGKSK